MESRLFPWDLPRGVEPREYLGIDGAMPSKRRFMESTDVRTGAPWDHDSCSRRRKGTLIYFAG